jgi:hypothetical protein
MRGVGAAWESQRLSDFWKDPERGRCARGGRQGAGWAREPPCPRVTPGPRPRAQRSGTPAALSRAASARAPRGAFAINRGPNNLHLICERFNV